MVQIEMKKVSKSYGKFNAVNSINLSIKKGELFGLLGPNGAGKTTIISMLTTQLFPTKGKIRIMGFDIRKEGKRIREQIGVLFQEQVLDNQLTAFQNLNVHAKLYKQDKSSKNKQINDILEFFELNKRSEKTGVFSGGLKRRLELARALLFKPKILFLDEPTLNLDPIAKERLWSYIKKINEKDNTTVIIATNSLEEAETLCSRIGILNKGRFIALGSINQIKKTMKKETLRDVFKSLIKNETK